MNAASVRLRRLYRPVAAPSARSGIARERAHTCFGRFGRSVPETHHLSIQHICSDTKRRQGGQVLPRYLSAGRWLFCFPDFVPLTLSSLFLQRSSARPQAASGRRHNLGELGATGQPVGPVHTLVVWAAGCARRAGKHTASEPGKTSIGTRRNRRTIAP